jgi:predicted RND superfamily exporter protein
MHFIARLSADHRALGWCIVIALSIPPILGFAGLRVAEPVPEGWVEPKVVNALREAEETFKFNATVVLVLECDDFFTVDRVTVLHKAAATARAMQSVHSLTWMGDIPEVTLLGKQTPLLPSGDDLTAEALATARQRLLSHPLATNGLISSDGKTVVFLLDVRNDEDVQPITATVSDCLAPAGIRTRPTGIRALHDLHDRTLDGAHYRIMAISIALVTLLSVLIFRRPAAILVSSSGPFVGLTWTLGWLALLGQSENELAKIILPVMVIMIGFTDGVHLVVRMRQKRAAGATPRDSVYDAVLHVGPACLLTSLTTAIGFGSLMISNSAMIAGFGRVSALGVVVTFCSVVLVSPLLANSRLGSNLHVNASEDSIFNLMRRCIGITTFASRYAKSVTAFGIVLTAFCLYACTFLVPDDSISHRIPHDSDEYRALQHCEETFGGIRYVRLLISWPEADEAEGGHPPVSRKEIWQVVEACEDILAAEKDIGPSMSIRSALTVFAGPDRRNNSVLANKLPDSLREQFYRQDIRKTQVVARVKDRGIAQLEPAFLRIETAIAELQQQHPSIQIEQISDQLLEGRVVRQMIEELMKSLAMASAIIFAVLAIAFRSLRVGLISIMPNIMPLAASGALRLLIDESLGIASACSFAICLGIAVDDTIHYLTHFRHERSLGATPDEANRRTFVSVGSALIMTTMMMMVGLGTVMTSGMPPHVNFAAMGCTTLAVALVADLLFLPALLSLFPGKSPTKSRPETADSPQNPVK